MKKLATLTGIGIISGIVLALFLKIIKSTTGNNVYDLLFDTSYIPVLNELSPTWLIESVFHFTTCILSIIVLYYVLRFFHMEKKLLPILSHHRSWEWSFIFFNIIFSEDTTNYRSCCLDVLGDWSCAV